MTTAQQINDGQTLRRWTDSGGGKWACIANDHSSIFCRRCVKLDEVAEGCLENVLDGSMTMRDHPDLGWQFHVTPLGMERAGIMTGHD